MVNALFVPIPLIPDARSDLFRTVIPIEGGQLFRFIPDTLSERSDATLVFDILLIRQFPSSFCFFCTVRCSFQLNS